MIKSTKSAFYIPVSNVCRGIGSVINLSGGVEWYSQWIEEKNDAKAIASDWEKIGNDFNEVLSK